jgi:hypothetical protein
VSQAERRPERRVLADAGCRRVLAEEPTPTIFWSIAAWPM